MGVVVYILIAFVLLARLVFQLIQLIMLLKGNETKKVDGIVFHTTERDLPPFSFFQHLVVSKSYFEGNCIEQIITHEKVHIKQWHMIDILLSEIILVLFWINPFAWLLKRTVKLNLEYIADEKVLNSGFDRKNYQINILTSCLNPVDLEMANLFTSSKIKQRIKMMNAKKSPLIHLYKYVLILPVISAVYLLINPIHAQVPHKNPDQDGTPLINAVQRGDLEGVKILLDKGADVNAFVEGDETPLINEQQ